MQVQWRAGQSKRILFLLAIVVLGFGKSWAQEYALAGQLLSQEAGGRSVLQADAIEKETVEVVKDVWPGAISGAKELMEFDDKIFFVGDHPDSGLELWSSDGTTVGTSLFIDIRPGRQAGIVRSPVAIGEKFFFVAVDDKHGSELWVSDGTVAGTTIVKDILPGKGSGVLSTGLHAFGGSVVFNADNSGDGKQLWISDGTAGGTHVFGLLPIEGAVVLDHRIAYQGVMLFVADDAIHGAELWRTDGTEAGTVLVKDIVPGPVGSFISYTRPDLTHYQGEIVFHIEGAGGPELWITDGTESGTRQFWNMISTSAKVGSSGPFIKYDNMLLFDVWSPPYGTALWRTDGSREGTMLVTDGFSRFSLLGEHEGLLYLSANDQVSGDELWLTDGTEAGTHMLMDFTAGPDGSSFGMFKKYAGKTYLRAGNLETGAELYRFDSSVENLSLVRDILPGPASSYPAQLSISQGSLFFTASSPMIGEELHKVTASYSGTANHETPAPGSIQSGVGLIRGWACNAGEVAISLDDGDLVPLAYGTQRGDTGKVCGSIDSGYGMVIAWGLLGDGRHSLKTFIDGAETASREFDVVTLGGEFLKGLSGEYVLENFPVVHESVRVTWNEADQNFVITGHDTGAGFAEFGLDFTGSPQGGYFPQAMKQVGGAQHESPSQHSIQSGVGLIRGWACEAEEVSVSLDGGAFIPMAYGTSRVDTGKVCGDNANGFGMVVSWADLGSGIHSLRTYVDGIKIADVEFAVVTIDEGFIKGLEGKYTLVDFPVNGQSVEVQWSQADQNFRITSYNVE